jgi:predicted HicB family RNase H-like nuclease
MNNLLTYKNYTGSVNYSSDDDIFYGKFVESAIKHEIELNL